MCYDTYVDFFNFHLLRHVEKVHLTLFQRTPKSLTKQHELKDTFYVTYSP